MTFSSPSVSKRTSDARISSFMRNSLIKFHLRELYAPCMQTKKHGTQPRTHKDPRQERGLAVSTRMLSPQVRSGCFCFFQKKLYYAARKMSISNIRKNGYFLLITHIISHTIVHRRKTCTLSWIWPCARTSYPA